MREHRIGFRDVLAVRSFAVLYAAEVQSIVGDQLARVALSVLVFTRTGSATATAATYAATLLPAVLGGVLLGQLGDRFPRRAVMGGVDALRACCFLIMAVPSVPLPAVMTLLVVAVAIGPVFTAAEVSYLATALSAEQFRLATATRMMSIQVAQVVGFVLGGVAVAGLGARAGLLFDAVTFALSVLAVIVLVPGRVSAPLPRAGAAVASEAVSDAVARDAAVSDATAATAVRREGATAAPAPERGEAPFAGLWRTPKARRALILSCLVGFFVVPEGLAVPFGDSRGAGTAAVGVLLASGALGGAIGAVVLGRLVPPPRRARVADAMAVACGLPLVLPVFDARWQFAAACWCASGVLAAYLVEATATLVHAIPDSARSRYIGIAGALLLGAQGVGLLVFGWLAGLVAPVTAIALAGAIGSALALAAVSGAGARRGTHSASHMESPG